jgi:phosphoribosylformimino-5-aminoimidazole carboxamide ribotide isomerase
VVNQDTLIQLGNYCDEFLVHGVEVEGKQCGILEDLVVLLGDCSPIPATYAGGVRSIADMELVKALGKGKVDLTIGSALDCFGGALSYDEVVAWHKKENE